MKEKVSNTLYGFAESLYPLYAGLSASVVSRLPIGRNVFAQDWDVLVVMDTCRVDALKALEDEYEFLEDINSITSVGSKTSTWMANTFTETYEEEINNTVLISENSHTSALIRERMFPEDEKDSPLSWTDWNTVEIDSFQQVVEPWQETTGGSIRDGTQLVTDCAVSAYRDLSPDRMVIHYINPHHPYWSHAIEEGRDELKPEERDPFEYLRNGGDFDTVWELYLDELRLALDGVEALLSSIDADTVAISADHGDGFGEMGVCYSHPIGMLHPAVRRVPWVLTTAENNSKYEPETNWSDIVEDRSSDDQLESSVEEQLEELGYL